MSAGSARKHFVQTAWFGTEEWVRRNSEAVPRFAEAMHQTALWANAHRKASAAILARATRLKPEIVDAMTRVAYGESSRLDPRLFQPVIDVAVRYGGMAPVAARDLLWDAGAS